MRIIDDTFSVPRELFPVIGFSFVIYTVLEVLICPFVAKMVPHYNKLDRHTQLEWCSWMKTFFHSSIVSVNIIMLSWNFPSIYEHPFINSHPRMPYVMAMSIGYFLCDTISICRSKEKHWEIILVHHILVITLTCILLSTGHAHGIGCGVYFMELTSPINAIWFCLGRMCRHSYNKALLLLARIAGFIFAVLWFVFRVLWGPWIIYLYLSHWREIFDYDCGLWLALWTTSGIIFHAVVNTLHFFHGPFLSMLFNPTEFQLGPKKVC